MYQNEQNDGTQYKSFAFNGNPFNNGTLNPNFSFRKTGSAANDNDVWYVKAGIKRTFTPAGATVLFGEWGQYNDMFSGLCGNPGGDGIQSAGSRTRATLSALPTSPLVWCRADQTRVVP